jgi:hypothetical protein
MPTRASQSICPQPPDYRHLLRPYTLLFIGCLLYSFLLGAVSHITSSDITEMVVKITKDSFGREFSFNALLVRSLPLVIVASLCATLAGMLTRTGGDTVRTLMVYLYGLQGSLLFFFVHAMDVLRDAFQRMLSSDDYIILAFLLLILPLSIQGYRMFRHGVNAIHEQPKVRLLLLLGFPLFFLVSIPLAGYLVVATNLSRTKSNKRSENVVSRPSDRAQKHVARARIILGSADRLNVAEVAKCSATIWMV